MTGHTAEEVRVLVGDIGVAAAILERKGFPMNALCVRTAIERLSDLLAERERMREAAGRICQFIAFIEADAEINDETIKDTATLLSFMGSGASDSLTMGDFRKLRAALTPEAA